MGTECDLLRYRILLFGDYTAMAHHSRKKSQCCWELGQNPLESSCWWRWRKDGSSDEEDTEEMGYTKECCKNELCDLKYAELKLIGFKKVGRKMTGLSSYVGIELFSVGKWM